MTEDKVPEFPFTNRFVFNRVLKNDPDIAVGILKIAAGDYVTDEELNELTIIDEAVREVRIDAKGSRLDIYMGNEVLRMDAEMNARKVRYLIKRTRYYLSIDDVDSLKKGESYDKLKKSIIIMIMTYDPFGLGKQIYTATERLFINDEKITDVTEQVRYDAQYVKIYLNAAAWDEETELGRFLKYVKTQAASDSFTYRINDEVEQVNHTDRGEIMTVQEEINELRMEAKIEGREEGKEEGRKEGRAEGRAEGRVEGKQEARQEARADLECMVCKLAEAGVSTTVIADSSGLSEAEIREIIHNRSNGI